MSPITLPVPALPEQAGAQFSNDKKPIRNQEKLLGKQSLDPDSVVRSVFFKTGAGKFVMLAKAEHSDFAKIQDHLIL